MDTIFDKILRKEIPTEYLYENEYIVAFHDIAPQAPVHVLVVPKQKFKSIAEAEHVAPDILGGFFQSIATVARIAGLNEHGYRVVFNCGKDGLQTVDYVHAHILGGRSLGWPPG